MLKLCTLLNEDPDKIIILNNIDEDSNKKHPFPCPCTYRTALSHYVEITALPNTHVLKEMVEFTSDPQVCHIRKFSSKFQIIFFVSNHGVFVVVVSN